MLAPAILSHALFNSLGGTALKSAGSIPRVVDFWNGPRELRNSGIKREAVVLGMSFIFGIALELLFHKGKSFLHKLPNQRLVRYIPQIAAILCSEILSRKLTNFNTALERSFHPAALSAKPARDTFEDLPDLASRNPFNRSGKSGEAFRSNQPYAIRPLAVPQASTMRGFY